MQKRNNITVSIDDVQFEWLAAMSNESGLQRAELVRRGLKRLMSAYPITADQELNERVALYLHRWEM